MPKYGCVERANSASRYEFYPFHEGALTIGAINRKLADYQHYYNTWRPHEGIGLFTPMEYYRQLTQTNHSLICTEPGHRPEFHALLCYLLSKELYVHFLSINPDGVVSE